MKEYLTIPKNMVAVLLVTLLIGCETESPVVYSSPTLQIIKITDRVYQHISFLSTESYGKVACNGMIVVNDGEALIFDTPTTNEAATETIDWIANTLNCKINAIVPTHFHTDCVGGIDAFHEHGIPSYANNRTVGYAKANNGTIVENGFDSQLEFKVGGKEAIAEFFGEGHTKDNIIAYFPADEVIFGGCLIKALGAEKGNLEDANIHEWPLTVEKLKEKYASTKIVIPGHGKTGGVDLFDYTIALFKEN